MIFPRAASGAKLLVGNKIDAIVGNKSKEQCPRFSNLTHSKKVESYWSNKDFFSIVLKAFIVYNAVFIIYYRSLLIVPNCVGAFKIRLN